MSPIRPSEYKVPQLFGHFGEGLVDHERKLEGNYLIPCRACFKVIIYGSAYVYFGFSRFHKSCAELPTKIQHPLHPHYPLTACVLDEREADFPLHPHYPLAARVQVHLDEREANFICDGCRHYARGLQYRCQECNFKLDVRCVSKQESQLALEKRIERDTHFHVHKLENFYYDINLVDPLNLPLGCCYCLNSFKDSASFACLKCRLFVHESCIDRIPQQVQNPVHRQHPLLPRPTYGLQICDACHLIMSGLMLTCEQCPRHQFHISCGMSTAPGFRLEYHEHRMFYQRQSYVGSLNGCLVCKTTCVNSVSYKCLECRAEVHIECIPLPRVIKHECDPGHILTLTDSPVVPNNTSNKYCCVVCEKEGDLSFRHHVYYCEDCSYIAHIDCVLSKEDSPLEILEYLVPRSREEPKEENDEAEKETDDESKHESENKEEQNNNIDIKNDNSEEEAKANEKEQVSDLEECSPIELEKRIRDAKKKMDALALEVEILQQKLAQK